MLKWVFLKGYLGSRGYRTLLDWNCLGGTLKMGVLYALSLLDIKY